jgi:hypothetical protein
MVIIGEPKKPEFKPFDKKVSGFLGSPIITILRFIT